MMLWNSSPQVRTLLNKHYRSQQQKPTNNKTGKVKFICFKHTKYSEDAFDCADRKNCTWSGN